MAETRKEAPSNGTTDEKNSTRTREIIGKRPESWSLPISVLAMIVSAVALSYNIWADKRVRQCDFDYRAYDRLSELGRRVDKEFATYEQYKEKYFKSAEYSDQETTEDPGVYLQALLKSGFGLSDNLIREFELNQVSFSNDEIDNIKLQNSMINEQARIFVDEVKHGAPNELSEKAGRELVKLFKIIEADLMRDTINGGLEKIAQRLRKFCS